MNHRIPPPDANAYKTDEIRQLPATYQAGQPLRDYPFHDQRSAEYNHLHPFHNA